MGNLLIMMQFAAFQRLGVNVEQQRTARRRAVA